MHILPKSRQDWLDVLLSPFKAYTIITPLVIFTFCRFPLVSGKDPDGSPLLLLVFGLFPCSAFLFFAGLLLTIIGSKNSARSCFGFGVAAFIIGWFLFPGAATA